MKRILDTFRKVELYKQIKETLENMEHTPRIKEISRNVNFDTHKETSSYRCNYKELDFDVLRINILLYGELVEVYEIESQFLPKENKSIYFKANQIPNGVQIGNWTPCEVSSHLKKVK